MKPKKPTRHGVRAIGKTATTISLNEALLREAQAAAEEDGRSFSNFVEQVLKEALRKKEITQRQSVNYMEILRVAEEEPHPPPKPKKPRP